MTQNVPEEARYHLTQGQILKLVQGIDGAMVAVKQSKSYIAQYEARAEMTRIFGFGNWDSQVEAMDLVYELPVRNGDDGFPANAKDKNKTYWITCYKASVRVNVRDFWGRPVCSFVESHVEENAAQPNRGEAHALALTSAESYALRRALIGLGDRLGLSLYNKGSVAPLVAPAPGMLTQLDDPESPQYLAPPTPRQAPMAAIQAAPPVSGPTDPLIARLGAGLKVDHRDGPNA